MSSLGSLRRVSEGGGSGDMDHLLQDYLKLVRAKLKPFVGALESVLGTGGSSNNEMNV
ncbi:hypothetical protein HDU76_011857, partial [Blyttiomyces sp. JEL0837]